MKKPDKMVEFKVPPFKPGMAAEVRFLAPDSRTHTSFNLIKDEQNYMIHGSFRWDQNILVLNTKTGGSWGAEVRVSQVCFKQGDDVAIRFEARDDFFLVYVNGKELNQYKHRLPLSDIKMAKTIPGEGIKVISYSVHF